MSNTYTINWDYGSGIVVEGAGFILNNQMDDFSVKPGVPNVYGVIGGQANEIQPGKRMLSSMSPTILLQNDKAVLVLGTPGGSTIFTSVFQTIVNIIDFDMTPLAATGATRFHHQLLPPELITQSIGRPLPPETISALGDRGYRVEPHGFEFGDVQVIWNDDGVLRPASDPRGPRCVPSDRDSGGELSDAQAVVHLVGSVPLSDADAVFRAVAGAVGGHVASIPDGETGDRIGWIKHLEDKLANHPLLEVDPDCDPFELRQWTGNCCARSRGCACGRKQIHRMSASKPAMRTPQLSRLRCSNACSRRARSRRKCASR